jgi:hypothetical protein
VCVSGFVSIRNLNPSITLFSVERQSLPSLTADGELRRGFAISQFPNPSIMLQSPIVMQSLIAPDVEGSSTCHAGVAQRRRITNLHSSPPSSVRAQLALSSVRAAARNCRLSSELPKARLTVTWGDSYFRASLALDVRANRAAVLPRMHAHETTPARGMIDETRPRRRETI